VSVTARRNARKRPKGYALWSPQQHTRELVGNVRDVLTEYNAHLPLTIRQVFYRLVGVYGYPKDENAYERLCNALNRARRAGYIAFDDLRDDGISVIQPKHYASVEGFYGYLNRLGSQYERDKLAEQEVDMRVMCEAAGIMPQLARTCRRYSVPVSSCSGFDSLTAKYELARACAATFTYQGRPTVLLHLGDLDPSGVSIYESMEEDVLSFVSKDIPHMDPMDVAVFDRVALSRYQVEHYGLTTYPPKATDARSRRWEGETCQLEALPPDTLAALLTGSIEMFLDREALEDAREAEAQERRQIARALPSA
jgi:hypothetical protein